VQGLTQLQRRDPEPETLISVAQAAALLGVHPNTIRSWTDAGRLTAYRINARGDRRFRKTDVERLLVEGSEPSVVEEPIDADRQDRELAVLARLATGVTAAPNATAVCRIAMEALRSQFSIPRTAIYLAHDDLLALETHAGYAVAPPAQLASRQLDPNEPVPATFGDGAIALPLQASGDTLGLLIVEPATDIDVVPPRLTFLRAVANAVALGVRSARGVARTRRELARARALRGVAEEISGQLDLEEVLGDIVDRTRTLFAADKAGLWLLAKGPRPFVVAAQHGLGDEFLAVIRSLNLDSDAVGVDAIRERRPRVVTGAQHDPAIGALREAYQREQIETACLVPLVARGEALGVMGLYHMRDHPWPEEEIALATSFASQASVAIANARLYGSVSQQAARMRSIQDLSARLNRLTDVQAIAEAIIAETRTLAEFHDIRVYTVDRERGICWPVAFSDRLVGDGDPREKLMVDIGEGSFTGWVAARGVPLLINDALTDPRGHTIAGTDDIDESMLLVPMIFEDTVLGVIVLSKLGTYQFTQDDLQTMTIFAGYAAHALANAAAYERLERQSTELARQLDSQRRLLEINETLLSTFDQSKVLEVIANGLASVVSFDNMSIYRLDRARGVLGAVLARENYAEEVMRHEIPLGVGLMGWAVQNREAVCVNDALSDPRAIQIPGTPADPEAIIIVPLVSDGEVTGAMNVSRIGREEAYFSQADFELVKLFAGQASIALRNADEHQAVTLRAETDALTGLGNHGAFQRSLAQLVAEAAITDEPLGLLMIDLDNFKPYNDNLGHPAGDALLHAIGTAIYGAARSEDRVFRYGGDEFAVILRGADLSGATVVGERIRTAVAALTHGEPFPVTVAIGAASFPADATDKDALISAADTALYFGKRSGEDRVVRAGDVPAEIRSLRGVLDSLARTALRHPAQTATLDHLVRRVAAETAGGMDLSAPSGDALVALARAIASGEVAAGDPHLDRVARLSGRVAEELHSPTTDPAAVELAARLRALAPQALQELAAVPSMRHVVEIIRRLHAERAEPAPFEPGAKRAVPLVVQAIIAAEAYDRLLTAGRAGTALGRSEAIEEIRSTSQVGARTIQALSAVVAARPDRGSRRRRSDSSRRVPSQG